MVLWACDLILIVVFLQLLRLGARRRLIRTWTIAWAAQLIGVSFLALQHLASVLDLNAPPPLISTFLSALQLPGQLVFLAFVVLGAMQIAGWVISGSTERRIGLATVLGALFVTFTGPRDLARSVLVFATPFFLFSAVQFVLVKAQGSRARVLQLLAIALTVFASLTSLIALAQLKVGGATVAGRLLYAALASAGWGGVLGTTILASAVIVIIVRDSFQEAEDTRSKRLRDLAASEARLSGIIEAAREAILTVDASGDIVMANAAAEQLFLLPHDRATGLPLSDLVQVSAHVLADVIAEATSPPMRSRSPGSATLTAAGRRGRWVDVSGRVHRGRHADG